MLGNITHYYNNADVEVKKMITGSIYPELLTFDGKILRTTRVNEMVSLMSGINKELEGKKTGQSLNLRQLSCGVTSEGVEPSTFRFVV